MRASGQDALGAVSEFQPLLHPIVLELFVDMNLVFVAFDQILS